MQKYKNFYIVCDTNFFEKKHRKGIKTLAVESLFTSISIGNLCGKFP